MSALRGAPAAMFALLLGACSTRLVLVAESDGGAPDAGTFAPVFAVSAGEAHACAIDHSTLFCMGSSANGALGIADGMDHAMLTAVDNASRWAEVSAAYESTCARTHLGEVFCVGSNARGQLGVGDFNTRSVLTRVNLPNAAAHISHRFAHSCVILRDASLYCWGSNDEGELGLGDGASRTQPNPVEVASGVAFNDVSCGQGHTCAVALDGALYCWGRNSNSELGLGSGVAEQLRSPSRVGTSLYRSVVAGQSHTCAITREGQIACWGDDPDADGDAGPCGLPGSMRIDVPTVIDARTDWLELATDTFHSCAIRSDNTLHCWGRNIEGQFGLGDRSTQHQTPTQVGTDSDWIHVGVGRFYTCAQKRDASVWCTGRVPLLPGDGSMDRATFTRI